MKWTAGYNSGYHMYEATGSFANEGLDFSGGDYYASAIGVAPDGSQCFYEFRNYDLYHCDPLGTVTKGHFPSTSISDVSWGPRIWFEATQYCSRRCGHENELRSHEALLRRKPEYHVPSGLRQPEDPAL